MDPRISHHLTRIACLPALALALTAGIARADDRCPIAKQLAPSPVNHDNYGAALASEPTIGSFTLVGIPNRDQPGKTDCGSVIMYRQSSNVFDNPTEFFPSDGATFDHFGQSVGMGETFFIVGAPGAGVGGAAYIYSYDYQTQLWSPDGKIMPSVPVSGDEFGYAVDVTSDNDDGWAVVGIRGYDGAAGTAPQAGGAFIFRRLAPLVWQNQGNTASSALAGDRAGTSVGITGEAMVIGAPFAELPGKAIDSGNALIRRRNGNTWTSYSPPDVSAVLSTLPANAHYGMSVDTGGPYIAIGVPGANSTVAETPSVGAKTGCGMVHVLRWNGATYQTAAILYATDASDLAGFGTKVHMSTHQIVVTAPGARRAYIFKRYSSPDHETWSQAAVIRDPDTAANGSFASDAVYAGGDVVVGDSTDDDAGFTNQGALFDFNWSGSYANDTCENPSQIPDYYTRQYCTRHATPGLGASCGNVLPQGPDVWMQFTPNCTSNYEITTAGSDFDTVLSIHSGCPEVGDTHTIACNDDAFPAPNRASRLLVPMFAGSNYLIRVAGYNGSAGEMMIRVQNAEVQTNDSCSTPQIITPGFTPFETCGASESGPIGGPECFFYFETNFPGDLWYRYTAPSWGTVMAETCVSESWSTLAVYPGPACPLTNLFSLDCETNFTTPNGGPCGGLTSTARVNFNVVPGGTYLLRMGAYRWDYTSTGTTGSLHLEYTSTCPCDFNNGGLSVQDIFDYLNAWFAGQASADFNGGGLSVQDIFDFLNCWFAGCS